MGYEVGEFTRKIQADEETLLKIEAQLKKANKKRKPAHENKATEFKRTMHRRLIEYAPNGYNLVSLNVMYKNDSGDITLHDGVMLPGGAQIIRKPTNPKRYWGIDPTGKQCNWWDNLEMAVRHSKDIGYCVYPSAYLNREHGKAVYRALVEKWRGVEYPKINSFRDLVVWDILRFIDILENRRGKSIRDAAFEQFYEMLPGWKKIPYNFSMVCQYFMGNYGYNIKNWPVGFLNVRCNHEACSRCNSHLGWRVDKSEGDTTWLKGTYHDHPCAAVKGGELFNTGSLRYANRDMLINHIFFLDYKLRYTTNF